MTGFSAKLKKKKKKSSPHPTTGFEMSDKQIMTAKALLRKKLYSVINNLPREEILRQSEIVTKKILENDNFQKASVVSVYLSMDNEIQTENLLEHIFKNGKECFIPRFQPGSPNMEMIRLSSMEQYHALPRNKWNIKQPPEDEQIESIFERGQLDVVLTPGLGFTQTGHRIGRGKGYYDKFFQRCRQELKRFPFTMGLAFAEQVVLDIPTEETDFCLDLVVSPK